MNQLRASLRSDVPAFKVMEVLTAAAQRQRTHGDVISLAAGQPSSPPPMAVKQAAARALEQESLGYTEQLGLLELRETIAGHYSSEYGLEVPAEQVALTTGASGGFLLAFLAAFEAGDRVALARPGYPAYRHILRSLGCEVVELAGEEPAQGSSITSQPTVDMLEALDQPVQGLIVASPANPTGTVLSGHELATLAEWCERNSVRLISDEIYHGISFGKALHTAREFSASSIVVNSFSKFWCMTGWRLGWMVLPEELVDTIDALASNYALCPPTLAQHAALEAFSESAYAEARAHVEHYRANRDLLVAGLADLGITKLASADGAFYLYADVSHLTEDSVAFAKRLLDDTGVAVVPGVDFDPVAGHTHIRLSAAGTLEHSRQALTRIRDWLAGSPNGRAGSAASPDSGV